MTTFSQTQLSAAFDLLCDPSDWRAPIDALVPATGVELAIAAIEHFTATTPKVGLARYPVGLKVWRVSSVGYRAGPAGP